VTQDAHRNAPGHGDVRIHAGEHQRAPDEHECGEDEGATEQPSDGEAVGHAKSSRRPIHAPRLRARSDPDHHPIGPLLG